MPSRPSVGRRFRVAQDARWTQLLRQTRHVAPFRKWVQETQRWRDSQDVIAAWLAGDARAVARFIRERLARDLYGLRD
jgi:hypothetical protein